MTKLLTTAILTVITTVTIATPALAGFVPPSDGTPPDMGSTSGRYTPEIVEGGPEDTTATGTRS